MIMLETVQLRLAVGPVVDLYHAIEGSLQGLSADACACACYRRGDLETDLTVHIHWCREGEEPRKSDAGTRLAESLKQYGLVEHTVWEELTPKEHLNRKE